MTHKLNEAGPYILLLILSLLFYLPVMTRASAAKADFGKHITRALTLPDSTDHVGHVLYHAVFHVDSPPGAICAAHDCSAVGNNSFVHVCPCR